MKWEDLKVYKPLTKEELKPAFKDFTSIVASNLKPFGFSLNGRKLIARSNDLLHIIHLDTRGSWSGINETYNTEIGIIAVSDKASIVRGFELTGCKKIEDIITGIRDHYRITREYPLLAEFITRKIVENILPYFDKYDRSEKILSNRDAFKLGRSIERNECLILFCELQNRVNIAAGKILDNMIAFNRSLISDKSNIKEYVEELEIYRRAASNNNWAEIEIMLRANEIEVLRKIKL